MSETAKPNFESKKDSDTAPVWWCNFCGFRTDERKAYLTHSCGEVLARQGKSSDPGTETHCR